MCPDRRPAGMFSPPHSVFLALLLFLCLSFLPPISPIKHYPFLLSTQIHFVINQCSCASTWLHPHTHATSQRQIWAISHVFTQQHSHAGCLNLFGVFTIMQRRPATADWSYKLWFKGQRSHQHLSWLQTSADALQPHVVNNNQRIRMIN